MTRYSSSLRRKGLVLHIPRLATKILIIAVLFNFVLSFVNANIFPLSRLHVILCELVIISSALILVATSFRPAIMQPWCMQLIFFLFLFLAIVIKNGIFTNYLVIQPKMARDMMIMPVFILLGSLCYVHHVIRTVIIIQVIVFFILILEAALPDFYGDIFNISSYYVNTRDVDESAVWVKNGNLFASANRPNDRFLLDYIGIHRLSSVFLEPVSLGNYCIIISAILIALWREMKLSTQVFFAVSTVVILIGSDGRLATVTCGCLLLCAPLFTRLPRRFPILYLPVCILLACVAFFIFDWQAGPDNFSGRVGKSVVLLTSLSLSELFGDWRNLELYVDSGVTYFIASQSLFGVFVFWLTATLIPVMQHRSEIIFVHAISFYIACNLLVSYSLFSIKTAALLWFVYGSLYTHGVRAMVAKRTSTVSPQTASVQADRVVLGPQVRDLHLLRDLLR